ncbi:hypothetical protein [Roseovarius mucosus]|uniref:hypothetical protein n=1 Tax=Roseovarius mucosus TaxID=215743 RepID=UPI0035CF8B5F
MKPNFALSLSFEGIGLLHRAGSAGWHLVGDVPLDAEDLAGELAALRAKAALLDPSGLSTKLIIPDEQIKYMDLPATSAPDGDYDRAAAEALEGATPYHIDDLVYDWSVEDGRLYIAAVASETLDEAEAFAAEHRFNPVSFVARPQSDRFAGEPFFGAAAQARGVDRDEAPVRILGSARLPEAPPPVESVASAAPVIAPAADAAVATPKAPNTASVHAPAPAPPAAPDKPAAPALKGEPDLPALSFSSVRAERGAPIAGAPKLEGAARITPLPDTAPAPELPRPGAAPLLTGGANPALTDLAAASLAPEAAKGAGLAGLLARRDKTTAPERVVAKPADEAERLTVFGARSQPSARGKPRFLGLILTALLLLLLVGVAAWSTIFGGSDPAEISVESAPEIALTPPIEAEPEIAVGVEAEPVPEIIPPEAEAEPEAVATTPPPPEDLTPDEMMARYAATGIWPLAPEPPAQADTTDLDEFYLTSIDEAVNFQDAVALPPASETVLDRRPETPAAPAPPGTQFTRDARGFVQATPEGALTPDGILVRAGPPPVRPPRPPPARCRFPDWSKAPRPPPRRRGWAVSAPAPAPRT